MSPARRITWSNSWGILSSTPGLSSSEAELQKLVYVTMAFSSQVFTWSLPMAASRSGRRRVVTNCSRALSAVSKLTLLTLLIECRSLHFQSVQFVGSKLGLSQQKVVGLLTYVRKVCSVNIEELTIRETTGRNASASAGLLVKIFSCITSTDIRLPIP